MFVAKFAQCMWKRMLCVARNEATARYAAKLTGLPEM